MPRRAPAVASAQNAAAEELFIKISRSVDVGDGDEMCDGESVARGHLIALVFDLNSAHLLILLLPCSYLLPTKPGEERQNNCTKVSRDTSASRFRRLSN